MKRLSILFVLSLCAAYCVAVETTNHDSEDQLVVFNNVTTGTPVALFHGVDDNCKNVQEWVDAIAEGINYTAPVKCVEIGDGRVTSVFDKIENQVQIACRKLHRDSDYRDQEISIVGLSQGGLISRSLVEQCEGLKVHTLYTFGGPHQGVSSF